MNTDVRHSQAHTYKFTKSDGSFKYVKLHFKTVSGTRDEVNVILT